jgi:hypothetical protein
MKTFYFLLFSFLILCFSFTRLQAQIPNSGLENWALDVDTNLDPVGWKTSNNYPSVGVEPVTPACVGSKAMRVKPLSTGGITIPGFASLGFLSTLRPTSLHMCLNATVMPGDEIIIYFSSYKNDSLVASPDSCTFKLLASLTPNQSVCLPIKYQNSLTPDSINITVIAGFFLQSQIGTQVTIDDLSFNCTTGIDETYQPLAASIKTAYPNPASSSIAIPLSLSESSDVAITVFDIEGRQLQSIQQGNLSAGEHLLNLALENLSNGIYYYAVKGRGFDLPGKFTVSK